MSLPPKCPLFPDLLMALMPTRLVACFSKFCLLLVFKEMLSKQLQLFPAVIPKPLEKFLLSDQESEYISLKFCSSGQPLFVATNRSLDNQESKSYRSRQDREGGVCQPPFIFPATPTPGE